MRAVLFLGFGGPQRPEEVRPFIEEVVRGKGVPEERIRVVEGQYAQIGGSSPYNQIVALQVKRVKEALARRGFTGEVFVGLRHSRPRLEEAVRAVKLGGFRCLAVVILSVARCEASWEEYLRELTQCMGAVGLAGGKEEGMDFHLLPPLGELSGFLDAQAEKVRDALKGIPAAERPSVRLVFTAHSIPLSMASQSRYEAQLQTACGEVSGRLGLKDYLLAFQSRSGPRHQPWLGPEVEDVLRALAAEGEKRALLIPIGFACDHAEVLYDLDVKAVAAGKEVGIECLRVGTVGDHPRFIEGLAEAIINQVKQAPRPAAGSLDPDDEATVYPP